MVAINHALTGAFAAVAIGRPALALPAAFLSHFVIDSLPHWNYQIPYGPKLRQTIIGFDLIASTLILLFLGLALDIDFWLFLLGGLLGMLPDVMWLPYIISGRPSPRDKDTPLHILRRFHVKVQWSETTKGLIVEVAWFILMLSAVLYIGR